MKLIDIIESTEDRFSAVSSWLDGLFDQKQATLQASYSNPRKILKRKHRGYNIGGFPNKNLSLKTSDENLLVVGGIGSGKTQACLLPTLCFMDGSFVINDPSGEIFNATASYLSSVREYNILRLKWDDVGISSRWNPLLRANTKTAQAKLAHLLVRTSLGKQSDPFWSLSAESLLLTFIQLVKCLPEKYQHMTQVRHYLELLQGANPIVDDVFARYADPHLLQTYISTVSQSDKVLGSIISTCKAATKLWELPSVQQITASDSLGEIRKLREVPTAIFIQNSVTDQSLFSVLTSLFYEQLWDELFSYIPSDQEQRIHFITDEFATLYFSSISQALNNCRKHRFSHALYIQSLQQLEDKYGIAGARSILVGLRNQAYFTGGIDLKTAVELEKRLGKTTIEDSKGRMVVQPLMSSDELQSQSSNQLLFFSQHHRGCWIKTKPFYKHRQLNQYASQPIHLPTQYTNSTLPLFNFNQASNDDE